MAQTEILKSPEKLTPIQQEPQTQHNSLTKAEVEEICEVRKTQLAEIRPLISLKFYHQICERLEAEKDTLFGMLDWEYKKQQTLSHYSFILNPYYFEQKFLDNSF